MRSDEAAGTRPVRPRAVPSDAFFSLMSSPPARPDPKGGWFSSRKFGDVSYDSYLELDFIRFCETEPRITFLRHRPCTLFFVDERGATRPHVPTFATIRAGAGTFIETMYTRDVARFASRRKALARELASHGIFYDVMTEHDIRFEPRLSNVRELLRGLGTEPAPAFANAVVALLTALPDGVALGNIPDILGVARDAQYALYKMILEGTIRLADPDAPLTPQSKLVTSHPP